MIETAVLDFCDADSRLSAADVVVAADVLYFPASGTMLARRVLEALESGSRVIVGDSPDQPGRAAFIEQLDALLPDVGVAERWVRALGGDRGEPMLGPLDGPPARAHLRQRLQVRGGRRREPSPETKGAAAPSV